MLKFELTFKKLIAFSDALVPWPFCFWALTCANIHKNIGHARISKVYRT
jgi:hypothetical protein